MNTRTGNPRSESKSAMNSSASRVPLPFGNGRPLPSKWEDAEKWILSPVVKTDNAGRYRVPHSHHQRPKSKSGPLGPPGYLSSAASPFDTGSSPSSTGGSGVGGGRLSAANADAYIIRSASVHGWSDTVIEPSLSSLPSSQGAIISRTDLRKDVATQMGPDGSSRSSPSPPSSACRVEETEGHFSKLDIRDVQMDDRRCSANITGRKIETEEAKAEMAKSISRYKKEEAKITAWEDSQKAKAEEEIKKLEMKLERKRLSSMEKILSKLRSSQRKAQEMRSAVTANQAEQIAGVTKRSSYFRRTGRVSASSSCFTCRAF